MALITNIIPKQNFELVRDQIGAILTAELANQKALQQFSEDVVIYRERLMPADAGELLFINVKLAGATFNTTSQRDAQGLTIFHIDLDVSGMEIPESDEDEPIPGSLESAIRLHKFLGMCMYIFRSSEYRDMKLAPVVGGTYIDSYITPERRNDDTAFTNFARIQLSVRIQEDTAVAQGVPLLINDTTVKLDLTEKGYKFVIDNTP